MNTEEYPQFVEAVFACIGFDENASDDQLDQAATCFDNLRRTWLTGETYIPSAELHATARRLFFAASPDQRREVARALELLSSFCRDKYRATVRRVHGMIEPATQFEEAAERSYNELPQVWKW